MVRSKETVVMIANYRNEQKNEWKSTITKDLLKFHFRQR